MDEASSLERRWYVALAFLPDLNAFTDLFLQPLVVLLAHIHGSA